MNINDAVKTRVLELCKRKDLTINKLAALSGVPQSTLSNIIKRNQSTTVATVKKICDGLNISIEEFFCSELFRNLEQEIQ